MSTVRMCDRCGRIFPEGEEGSAVGTVTVMVRDPQTGRKQAEQRVQDSCALCTNASPQQPRLLEAAPVDE